MTNAKIERFLSDCPVPDSGCFAGDPVAFALMTAPVVPSLEALVVQEDMGRAAEAAMDAGIKREPLEDTTYTRATVDPAQGIVGSGPERGVLEAGAEETLDEVRFRIARCAEACGRNAVSCPVFQQLT